MRLGQKNGENGRILVLQFYSGPNSSMSFVHSGLGRTQTLNFGYFCPQRCAGTTHANPENAHSTPAPWGTLGRGAHPTPPIHEHGTQARPLPPPNTNSHGRERVTVRPAGQCQSCCSTAPRRASTASSTSVGNSCGGGGQQWGWGGLAVGTTPCREYNTATECGAWDLL